VVAPEGLQVAGFKLTPLQGKNSWPTTATLTLRAGSVKKKAAGLSRIHRLRPHRSLTN
jgi:hypothetical protein